MGFSLKLKNINIYESKDKSSIFLLNDNYNGEDFVKSYPFDEIQSNLSIVQGQFETLKADMETVITSIGTVVINGKVVTSCRDASGRPASPRQKGLVFIQFADGTVKKVYNK